jgi:hypothetical protein
MTTALTVIENNEGTGLENIGIEDQLIPRIQIAAGTSKQLKPTHELYVEGLVQGKIFNTVTGEIYGDIIQLVPLWYSRNRIFFDKDGKQQCKSTNAIDGGKLSPEGCASCPYSKWGSGKEDEGYACTEFRNFAVAKIDGLAITLASISFKSSGTPTAKKWVSLIEARKAEDKEGTVSKLPMWRGQYKFKVAEAEGKRGAFYKGTINNAGEVDDKLLQDLEKAHHRFKQASLTISSVDVESDLGAETDG